MLLLSNREKKGLETMKIIIGLLSAFVSLPITFYIQYKILLAINASELVWFLFWINLPLIIFIAILTKVIDD